MGVVVQDAVSGVLSAGFGVAGSAGCFACGMDTREYIVYGALHVRVSVVSGVSQGLSEVCGTDEEAVDALDGEDLIKVANGGYIFDLDTDEGLPVGLRDVVLCRCAVPEVRHTAASETAFAFGVIAAGPDGGLSLGLGVNVRDLDAHRAAVEIAIDERGVIALGPDNWGDAADFTGKDKGRDRVRSD